jgi:hypothetical protein
MSKCKFCGYYEDSIAWHYEDCPILEGEYLKGKSLFSTGSPFFHHKNKKDE